MSINTFNSKSQISVSGKIFEFFDITSIDGASNLPFSLKVLLENLLRTEDGANITADQIRALASWDAAANPDTEIQFTPARVVMQDFTGVPCIVDLATMREAIVDLGGDPAKVNPLAPAELVIDHSVIALEQKIPSSRTPTLNMNATWNDTASCDGAKVPLMSSKLYRQKLESSTR
jgi:aconitate hydratase